MAETLLTIQEAAEVSQKSVQTIRRALKNKKLESRKKKTPQGFNYLVREESLISLYKLTGSRKHKSLSSTEAKPEASKQTAITTEFATKGDMEDTKKNLNKLVDENRKDKETFMRFVKIFQDRFTALENQVKLLEEPTGKKRWFQFWKRSN